MPLKQTIRMSPWFNKTEWEAVYLSLYSDNIENKKWAVERVAAWKSRVHPTLHIAIDATTSIVRAIIQDNIQNNCQPTDISLLYSIALIRFVNVITELDQNKMQKKPIREIAQKNNIPEWIVDLRHSATHSNTPSLQMLRMGADFALNWLKEYYWEPEKAQFAEVIPTVTDLPESEIKDLISSFQQYQFDCLYSSTGDLENKRIVIQVVKKINKILKVHGNQFLQILCEPGYFLPAHHHLICILSEKEKKFFFEDERLKLPYSLQRFWQPILNAISYHRLLTKFLELLLESQSNPDPLLQKIAMAWANKMLKDILEEDDSEPAVTTNQSINWTHLLAACLKSPSKYCPEVLPKIVTRVEPPLTHDQKRHAMALVAVYLGAATDEKPVFSEDMNKVYQLYDMEFSLDMNKAKGSTSLVTKNISEGHWTLCSDVDWTNCPIGDFPGGFSEEANQSSEEKNEKLNAEQTEKDMTNKNNLSNFQEETHFQDKMQLEEFTIDINNCDPEKTLTCLPNKILIF